MFGKKGNPYHRKGGKGGGQFVRQQDVGVTNATDNQKAAAREKAFGKRDSNPLAKKKPVRPKALPLEKKQKEIIVGEGTPPPVEDNPQMGGKGKGKWETVNGELRLKKGGMKPEDAKVLGDIARKSAGLQDKKGSPMKPGEVRKIAGNWYKATNLGGGKMQLDKTDAPVGSGGAAKLSPEQEKKMYADAKKFAESEKHLHDNDPWHKLVAANKAKDPNEPIRDAAGNLTEKEKAHRKLQEAAWKAAGLPMNQSKEDIQDEDRRDEKDARQSMSDKIKTTGKLPIRKNQLAGDPAKIALRRELPIKESQLAGPLSNTKDQQIKTAQEAARANFAAREAAKLNAWDVRDQNKKIKLQKDIENGQTFWEMHKDEYMKTDDWGVQRFDAKLLISELDRVGIKDKEAVNNIVGYAAMHAWDKPDKPDMTNILKTTKPNTPERKQAVSKWKKSRGGGRFG